ncbi:hypothetical protein GCM10009853_015930 [Glycomyces scopariae]
MRVRREQVPQPVRPAASVVVGVVVRLAVMVLMGVVGVAVLRMVVMGMIVVGTVVVLMTVGLMAVMRVVVTGHGSPWLRLGGGNPSLYAGLPGKTLAFARPWQQHLRPGAGARRGQGPAAGGSELPPRVVRSAPEADGA